MNLLVKVFDYDLSPDQLQLINPVLILVLLPPITMMWHVLARFGLDLKPTSKMLIGFVLTAITMAIVAWSAFYGAGRIVAGRRRRSSGPKKARGDRRIDAARSGGGKGRAGTAVRRENDSRRRRRSGRGPERPARQRRFPRPTAQGRRGGEETRLATRGLKKANLEAIAVLCQECRHGGPPAPPAVRSMRLRRHP